jgi:hypothetical protein
VSSTTTIRSDAARTGTNPNFPINGNAWRKYLSINLGAPVRAGVLVVENRLFNAGPFNGQTRTLVLVATATNEIYCYSEGDPLANSASPTPLWHTPLGVTPVMLNTSNIAPPIGICGTPVVDAANRRMFVVAMWDNSGTGTYSIFNIALDTGNITASQQFIDAGAPTRVTFDGGVVDQRTGINLVGGWL